MWAEVNGERKKVAWYVLCLSFRLTCLNGLFRDRVNNTEDVVLFYFSREPWP